MFQTRAAETRRVLLSALDRKAGFAALTRAAWKSAAEQDRQDSRLLDLMEDWHGQHKLDWISRREFDDLVTAAIQSPGVILGRALRRHFTEILSPDSYAEVVALAWHGLRPYLDNPVFWARLPKGKPVRVLQRACLDGNLEEVLDEHFWMRRQSLPTREHGLAADLPLANAEHQDASGLSPLWVLEGAAVSAMSST
jgi:hypothetical protein